jgi:hypothetical protein
MTFALFCGIGGGIASGGADSFGRVRRSKEKGAR